MVKISTNEELTSQVAQLTALLDGTVLAHAGAIVNLQNTQVEQQDQIIEQGAVQGEAIVNLQNEQVQQDSRITALENA